MKNWEMNEKTIRQVEYYVARMQKERSKHEASLRSVIANLFSREQDAAKDSVIAPAYMKPLTVPMDSAYVLADYIIELTGKQCELTELFLEDKTAAIDQMLNEVAEGVESAEELINRYHLISQGLERTAKAFAEGKAVPAELPPYEGEISVEAAYALRGRIVAQISALNPSEEALRLMSRKLRQVKGGNVASFACFAHGGMEIKAMTAAVVYALRCDGSLPAEADEIMLEQIVCEVCRDVDMQAVTDTMQLSEDAYSTVYVLLGSAFVIGVSAALFSALKGSTYAAMGAAVAANPVLALVAAVAVLAVLPFVFEKIAEMLCDTASQAADFVREHEKEVMAVKQAAREAREKCAAAFDKVADYIKDNVVEPVRGKVEQFSQQAVVQQAEQNAQA